MISYKLCGSTMHMNACGMWYGMMVYTMSLSCYYLCLLLYNALLQQEQHPAQKVLLKQFLKASFA